MARVQAGALVGSTFRLVFGNLPVFLRTVGVPFVLVALLGLASTLTLRALPPFTAGDPKGLDYAALGRVVGFSLLFGIASLFAQIVCTMVGCVAAARVQEGRTVGFQEAWSEVRPRFGAFLATTLLLVATFVGIMLLGLVGIIFIVGPFIALGFAIYLAVRWVVAPQATLFEGSRAGESLKRSSELTKGARGAIFGAVVLLALAILVPILIVVLPVMLATFSDRIAAAQRGETFVAPQPTLGASLLQWALGSVISFFSISLFAAFGTILYRELLRTPAEPVLGHIGEAPMP